MKDCVICSHGWRNAEGENRGKTARPLTSHRGSILYTVAWDGGSPQGKKQPETWGRRAGGLRGRLVVAGKAAGKVRWRGALRAEVIGLVEGPRMERTGEMHGKEVGRRRGWGVPCWGEEIWGKCCKRGAREGREKGGVRARERKGVMWGLKLKWATYGKGEAHVGGKRRKRRGPREIRLLKKDCVLFRASLKSPSFTWHQT